MLAAGAGAWRLSQGPIGADALRPAVERWLGAQVAGGKARVGEVSIAWFAASGSLGLHLDEVSLVDGRGRPVLRARQADAALALASLPGVRPALGRLAAQDFFAAVSVSPQGRYQLGYDAAGSPPKTGGNLWRDFDDLADAPKLGRPLSFLQDVALERGTIALQQVGGPVAWSGRINQVRLSKAGGRLESHVDVQVADAALVADARGAVGLKQGQVQARLANLDPARVFPWVGATGALSVLDAPVQGRASLRWAADRGVQIADVQVEAGAGHVRLSGEPTAFQSGALRAAYDPRQNAVLIQTASVAAAQAQFNVSGRAWVTPESARTGPARLQLALDADHARVSFSPAVAPAPIDGFVLRASYVPATGRLDLSDLHARLDGAPLTVSGVLQRPRLPRSWGADLSGRVDGMVQAKDVTAIWPNELGREARTWTEQHLQSGRLGHAAIEVHLAPGAMAAHRPLPNAGLRLSYQFEDAVLQLMSGAPPIERLRGTSVVQGNHFEMTVQSGDTEGVRLGQGSVEINHMVGPGKRLLVRAHAAGDAQTMLDVVDRSTGGGARARGLDPQRVTGVGDVAFTVSRALDAGPDDYQASYAGTVRQAKVADAAMGLALTSAAVKIDGTLQRLSAQGVAQLGPYRGPLQYVSDFPAGKPASQHAQFDGALDASTYGLSGPAGSDLRFNARFDSDAQSGHGQIRGAGFNGDVDWGFAGAGHILLKGVADASDLRGVGVPLGAGLPDKIPVRLSFGRSGGVWNGLLEADAYSGTIVFSGGPTRRLRYLAQLTPAEAQRLGLRPADKATSLALDVSMTGDDGAASYSLGPSLGQVSWSDASGPKGQYRWRTTLSAADLHSLGLPAGIEPKAPLPVDLTLTSAAGGWNGSAQVAGGSFRFSASPPVKGRRRLNIGGGADGAVLANLGLVPEGMITGPTALSAALDLGPDGLRGGHVEADLQRAAVSAPYVTWKKPAGREMRIDVDFAHTADGGWEASSLRGQGPGFGLNGSAEWKSASGGVVRLSAAKLEGAFEGSLDLAADNEGHRLTARARYFDARRLIQEGGKPAGGSAGVAAASAPSKPFALDVQLAQVRVSETGLVRNVRIAGAWGGDQRRPLDLTVTRDNGSGLITLRLTPDATGLAVNGQVSDVGEAAVAVFGQRQFRGGQASVTGHLVQGGADLHVEMTKVRLLQAPALARILTMGSLKGMADTLNGAGIEFAKVSAPVQIRDGRLTIARARATGPAMGITTQGVIDIDSQTVDLSGGIAPSYALNSVMGQAPLIGGLFVPHKGEGMFGLTYSAKGAFTAPKISVNPLSLAAPGILRRIFEAHSAASVPPDGG